MRSDTRSPYRLSMLAPLLLCAAILSACRGGDDSATASASASTVVLSVAEGADVLAYVGQTKTVTLSFKTSDGAAATKLNLSLPAASGWQSQTGGLSCATVEREGSCVLRLSYTPAQAATAATLRLPYSYVDSAGANQSGSVALTYRALVANAAVVTATPNPVPGIVSQPSTVTINFATNDGSIASALSASFALPAAWSSEVSNFTCASFGGGTPCQLTLRYAPTQATSQSSFKVGYSYVDSAGRAQSDAISIGYSAVAPNSARVAIGGVNLASATLIAVNPGESQDVSFTFTSSDGNALGNLQLAQGASLPAGWTSDAALSTFSCAEVTQDGKCQLILHFKPTDQAQGRQTLALDYTYRNAVGQSMSGSASIGYTSKIYRLYAAGTQTSLGVSQCWLKMAPGVGRYNLDACDDPGADVPNPNSPPPSIQRIVISGSNAYLLDISTYVIKVCSVDVDGALFDCQAKIAAPANTSSISVMGDALYALVEKSTGTSLYACPLSLEAGCEPVTVNFSNNVAGIFLHMTGDGGALFLVDSLQMVQRCSRFESGGFNLQCEAWPTMAGGLISSLTAGQFAASSYVFLGINDFSKGPEFSKCSATSPQCTYMTFINNSFPSGGNASPLTLIDMSFANIDSTNPALYLLVTDLINQKRGIVRCTLVTTQTSSSPIDIADQLTCGAYTGIDGSTISAPISIAIR